MSKAGDAWFWFPDYCTGLAYRDGLAEEHSHVLRVDESTGEILVVQFAPPEARLMCFDVPDASDSGRYGFSGGSDNGRTFTTLLTPEPADRPGVLAAAPDGWKVATVSWLTTSEPRPLQVRQLERSRVSNPKFITAADVQASLPELADVTLSFAADDRVGPAFSPVLMSEMPHVLVTFPAVPSETHLDIQIQLLGSVKKPVPVQLLFRDPHKRQLIVPIDIVVPTAQSPKKNFPIRHPDMMVRLDIYVQVPEGVRLSYRDGNGLQVEAAGGLIARRLGVRVFQPVDHARLSEDNLGILRNSLQRLQQFAEAGLDGTGNPGIGDAVRHELARRHRLAELFDEGDMPASINRIPAPLFAALIEHVGQERNRVDAARRFLRWPAASQLQRSTKYCFEFNQPRPGNDHAASVVWQKAEVVGDLFRWLAADPERQIRILPLISPAIDVPRLLDSIRKVRHLKDCDLEAVANDLIEIANPDWPNLFSLTLPDREFHQRGSQLLELCAIPPSQGNEIRLHHDRLRQYEDGVRGHLGRLVGARRQFTAYSAELAVTVEEFKRSRRDGLAALACLAKKYVRAGERGDVGQDLANLVGGLENGVASEFCFDLHVLYTAAAELWEERKQQAPVVHWVDRVAQLLNRQIELTEVPDWSDDTSADNLAASVSSIRQFLTGLSDGAVVSKVAALAPELQVRAVSLRSAVAVALEKCRNLVASARTDSLDLATLFRLVERLADRIVFECLRNEMLGRQRALLERHAHFAMTANETLDHLMERALPENPSMSAESLNEWWGLLDRVEQDIKTVESQAAALAGLPADVRRRLPDPRSPEFHVKADAEVAIWKIEAQLAGEQLARAMACVKALGDQPGAQAGSSSIDADPSSPPETNDADSLERLLAWSNYRERQLGSLGEARSSLSGTIQATLRQQCPTVPWGKDAGEKIANVLLGSGENEPAETLSMFTSALNVLHSIWEVTGGDRSGHVRDLLWLLRDEPIVGEFEIVFGAVENPERLVDEADLRKAVVALNALRSQAHAQAFTRDFTNFHDRVGKTALDRLYGLDRDPAPECVRILRTIPVRTSDVKNPSRAIAAVRAITDFTRRSAAGDHDAAALRTILARHNLLPAR